MGFRHGAGRVQGGPDARDRRFRNGDHAVGRQVQARDRSGSGPPIDAQRTQGCSLRAKSLRIHDSAGSGQEEIRGRNTLTAVAANQDPRVYLAVERTFLAWIRTGLALMGFGFVVARFGLFLRELAASGSGAPIDPSPFSLPLGAALILTGVVVNLLATRHYVRVNRELNRGGQNFGRPSTLAIVVAVLLS